MNTPILLSVAVLPGVGQMCQKRWAIGLLHCLAFLGCFLFLIYYCWLAVLAFSKTLTLHGPWLVPLKYAGIWLALGGAVYALNVADVWLAERRKNG